VNGDKGAALITAILILSFLAVLGASQVVMIISRLGKITLEADRMRAYYLAEAGYAKCQKEMETGFDPDQDGIGTIPLTRFGDGLFVVLHNYGEKTINATGVTNDVKRSIFIKYDTM